MKRWLLAATFGVVALGLMLYPLVGELLSEKYRSDIETAYTAAIEDADKTELTAQRQAAEQYNAMLSGTTITEGGASAPPLAYAQQLTVGGVMAYVDIPKINVYLPVQHGTDVDTLEKSVGHVVGTSLPVGGSSTHAVLSAHSGMASSTAAAAEKPAASSWMRHYLIGLGFGLGAVAVIGGAYFLVRRVRHA